MNSPDLLAPARALLAEIERGDHADELEGGQLSARVTATVARMLIAGETLAQYSAISGQRSFGSGPVRAGEATKPAFNRHPVLFGRMVLTEVEKGTAGVELNFAYHLTRTISALAGLLAFVDAFTYLAETTGRRSNVASVSGQPDTGRAPARAARHPIAQARLVLAEVETRARTNEMDVAYDLGRLIAALATLLTFLDDFPLRAKPKTSRGRGGR
ncbi:hypothetical protein [Streptomyces sp. NPDC090025]|uniref:hypothetical protein n=1 Tax=Streptomyces sp. NPDC090025 TaxID=3365922 RepID=UPI003837FE02